MELLRGHDLGWHLRQRGALPLDEVVALAEQVAGALESARKAGIVHRDLKPQNLFLAQQHAAAPAWKILDFGVSRLAGNDRHAHDGHDRRHAGLHVPRAGGRRQSRSRTGATSSRSARSSTAR